jgi:plastocyanin
MSKAQLATPARVMTALTAVVAGLVLVTACSSSSKSAGGSTPASGATTSSAGGTTSSAGGASTASGKAVTIDVKNFSFNPQKVVVSTGTAVTWKFEDSAQHTVKADNGAFSSTPLSNNQTYSFTFNTAGTYSYICSIHQYMTGSVVVQ